MPAPHDEYANAIAIIGMDCRFPGAIDPAQFWDNLQRGVESICHFSRDQLLAAGVPAALADDPAFVSAHGALDDVAAFDADFFAYTPAEAAWIDPQHRLLLECAWRAMEDAGIIPGAELTGVFAGCGLPAYLLRHVYPALDGADPGAAYQAMLGNDKDFLSSRIAYKLDLGGPALSIQAACATSLACVHAACQSLLNGECDSALAGAVSLRVPQASGYLYQAGGIHSADGHCRAFDAAAGGTVGGSGAGVVVLQRLADAIASGATIHAVIRASAVNNDGARKLSFTAPGVDGQAAVIREAHAVAGVELDSIDYIETHGTGTALGDPIEMAALAEVFGQRQRRCLIGSVKTNIGHLDAAAGMAGLIKTVLALRHALIPASLHFKVGNPNIAWDQNCFEVCTAATPWPAGATPRRAGLSSFGLGGCNAHLVLEQAPIRPAPSPRAAWRLYPLSARSPAALARMTARLTQAAPALREDGLAHTLALGRQHLAHAGFALADSAAALAKAEWHSAQRPPTAPRVAFLYPGQGAQRAGVARLLYQDEPVFRSALDRCAEALLGAGAPDVRALLVQADQPSAGSTEDTQCGLFALAYALTALWRARGIEPAAVLGHSAGEYGAAVTAGIWTLEQGAQAIAARARLMAGMPPGAMSAIGLSESELRAVLPGDLTLAAVNGPALCTVAGAAPALAAFEASLAGRALLVRRLETEHAFHSAAVDPLLAPWRTALDGIAIAAPVLPFYSALLGARASSAQASERSMWVSQMREPVRFGAALEALLADGYDALVEIGPGATLTTLAGQAHGAQDALLLPGLDAGGDPRHDLLGALGQLWLAGARPRWQALFEADPQPLQRIGLPVYPFEPTRHWLDAAPAATAPTSAPPGVAPTAPGLQWHTPDWHRLAPLGPMAPAALAGDWLVLGDQRPLSARLVERLRALGARVTLGHGADIEALPALLARCAPQHIVLCWDLEPGEADIPPNLAALMRLAQAVAHSGAMVRAISVITDGALDVTGSEVLRPDQATLLGPVSVMPLEFPQLACRLIDVDAGAEPLRQAQALCAELAQPGAATVALRGPHRWGCTMRAATPATSEAALRPDGVYLITGGLGGLGLAIAERLAAAAPVRLALLARGSFPAPNNWSQWLAEHASDDPTSLTIGRLRMIEAGGAAVQVWRADCADQAQMAAVLNSIKRQWGALRGVIHAAGVAGGGAMALRQAPALAAVLRPKTRGTRVLIELLDAIELDFLVFFSSINSLRPVPGQADYAAANAYLDASAALLRRRAINAITINWDAWREVGMAASAQLPESLRAARAAELAATGLSTQAACDAFMRIIGAPFGQVAVTTGAAAAAPAVADDSALDGLPDDVGTGMAALWCALLGVASVAPQDDFFRLGGHSLLATRVGFRVRQRWGMALSLEDIFTHPTLGAQCALIEARIAAANEREVVLF